MLSQRPLLSFSGFANIWLLLARRPRTTWWVALGAVIAIVTATLCIADEIGEAIRTQYQNELRVGGNVIVLASDVGRIDRGQCSRLAYRDDVMAAGFVAFGNVDHASHAPGVGVLIAESDAGALTVLAPESRPSQKFSPVGSAKSLVVAQGAAFAIGVEANAPVSWALIGSTRVNAVIDVGQRAPQMERWAFAPAGPTGFADECWVEATEGNRPTLEDSLRASVPSASGGALRVLRSDPPELAIDPTVLRVWDVLPWAGALGVAAVMAGLWLADRIDLALLQVNGMRRREAAVLRAMHSCVTIAVGLGVGVGIWLTVGVLRDVPTSVGALRTVPLCLASGVLASVLLSLIRPKNAVLLLRDRT